MTSVNVNIDKYDVTVTEGATDLVTVTAAGGLTFTQEGNGAQARTVDSKLKDIVNVADFGATGDGTTNDTTAIQNAINSLNNGGVVEFNVGTFLINQTLNLTKKIHLVGKGGYFLNQFVDNQFTVGGTTIKLADGSNTDMLKVQLDNASIGADYRSHCSIRNIHFFGNRSNAQNPTDTTSELNSSGNGIVISGVRYVTLENVIVTKCADDGLKLQSHTYSSSSISTNNIDIRACAFHSNGKNGATLAGGDSIMDSCTVGYNANNGVTTTGFGVISNSLFWDNFDNGIFVQGSLENPTIVGNKIYDNDHVGIYLDDAANAATSNKTATAIITGNKIIRNGGNSSSVGSQSSGIFINTVAINELVINGNEIGNTDDLWDTSKSYTTGNRVINAGRLYIATASISSGGSAPTHTSGTTNNWEENGTVQDFGVYFNKTETIIRGFAGNEITRNFINNIFTQTGTNPIVLEVPGAITAKGTQEPQIIIQDSDSAHTGNAAETGISFRDGGGTQQGIMGFSNSGDQDFYFDTASTSAEMNFRVAGSTTQLKVLNTGVNVVGVLNVSDDLTVDTNVFHVDASSNRVGIGTTSPIYKLDVVDNDASGVVALNLRNSNSTNEANTRIRFQGTRATDSSTFHLGELRFINTDSTNRASNFTISTHSGGSTTEKMRIYSNGLVEANASFSDTYSSTTSINPHLRARNQHGTDNIYGGIQLRADRGTGAAAIANIACLNTSTNFESILVFQSRNTDGNFSEKLRLRASGGLTFNGDTAATNALNDYEEGTAFTSTGNATVNQAAYTKVGKMVTISFRISVSAGNTQQMTLPFAHSGNHGDHVLGVVVTAGTFKEIILDNHSAFTLTAGFSKGTLTYPTNT